MFTPRWTMSQSELPFKYVDSEGTHTKAAEGFARAARNGMVRGQPAYLLRATLPLKQLVDYLSKGDIRVYPDMHTVAFTKKMTTAADETNKILETIKDNLDNLQAQWTAQKVNPETEVHGFSDDWMH